MSRARDKNPMFVIFKGMRGRCYNPNNRQFKHYGGRGITICDRWKGISGFKNFCDDMGEKPSPKHSVDRIDVNGNYEPSNVRWANPHEQAANKRNNRKYIGVSLMHGSTWRAEIHVDGKKYIKHSHTEEQAILDRKELEMKYLKY